MYRSVLALLFAAVLLLSGCAAGRQTVPKEKSGQETNMDGPAPQPGYGAQPQAAPAPTIDDLPADNPDNDLPF